MQKSFLGKVWDSLYWKISAIFLVMLIIIGFAYIAIAAYSSNRYACEVTQQVNSHVAQSISEKLPSFSKSGMVMEEELAELRADVKAINPMIEVYLLSPNGEILGYAAPVDKLKLNMVDLDPIKKFIDSKGKTFVLGEDPRNKMMKKVFSATAVGEKGKEKGYIYVILASEEYHVVMDSRLWGYLYHLGTTSILFTIVAAIVIGLGAIWLLTSNLRNIISTVKKFQEGDLTARVHLPSSGEIADLGSAFNDMADTILANIEDMKSADILRRELVANISHDLRTPLAVIHGYIETLMMKEETLTNEERKRYIEIIMKSTAKLKKMVSELFELSKLEAKQVKPKKEPFFMQELVQDAYYKYDVLAREKGVELKTVVTDGMPMVLGDISLIERVLQNLLDNAIKFTPEGGEVFIKLVKKEKAIEVQVSDTGVGIANENIPYVFERYQTHTRTNGEKNTIGGFGLGLAIVKKILELHDTTPMVTSKLQEGARFSFQLPVYG
ncbi:MAG: HAMP domain-containing sensor histidine kinase [Chitinophagales bacterium]